MKMTSIRKKVWRDCIGAVWVTAMLSIVEKTAGGLIAVFSAGVLGGFADAVFRLDVSSGGENLGKLGICLALSVLVLPYLGLLCNVFMLNGALKHERMLMGRFLDKDYQAVTGYDPGDMQQRLDWDSCNMRIYFVQIIESVVMIPPTLIILLTRMLAISPLFSAVVFAVSLIKLIVPLAVRRMEQKFDRENREYAARVRSGETVLIENAPMVKLYGLSDGLVNRLGRQFGEHYQKTLRKSIPCGQAAGVISGLLDHFCTLLILLAGAILAAKGQITPGSAAAMVGYFGVFHSLMGDAGFIIRKLPILRNLAERVEFFYQDMEECGEEMLTDQREITAVDLRFSYPDRPVLNGLRFTLRPGEKVAIVGPNGSGKSTLVKILCGLLNRYDGGLCVGGRELKTLSPHAWRNCFAYASQDPLLFAGRVEENIRLGRLSASAEEVLAVMEQVGISHLRGRVINGRQNDLSGGEKQKISIARALLKGADLLILDEPGNNLDRATLDWLKAFIGSTEMTVLYISHDEALTAAADRCIVLKETT